jgi:hypothetical protein
MGWFLLEALGGNYFLVVSSFWGWQAFLGGGHITLIAASIF